MTATASQSAADKDVMCDFTVTSIRSDVDLSHPNPYVRLFYNALAASGVQHAGTFYPSCRWLSHFGDGSSIFHFHWPEYLLKSPPSWISARLSSVAGGATARRAIMKCVPYWRFQQISAFLNKLRADQHVIWTVHNTVPHDNAGLLEKRLYSLIAERARLFLCHDEATRELILPRLRDDQQCVLMPHGNFKGVFPDPQSNAVVRDRFGISPDTALLVCAGQIRDYKGFETALDVLNYLEDVHLLIAGESVREYDLDRLKAVVDTYPSATLLPYRLSDQEFSDVVSAADLVVLPYRRVTGSGALLAALTLGTAVVASDLAFFREIMSGRSNAGALFSVGNVGEMIDAIRSTLAVPKQVRHESALRLAADYDWNEIVKPVVRAIRSL
jgi:beta-1,4-mannosyltransferase